MIKLTKQEILQLNNEDKVFAILTRLYYPKPSLIFKGFITIYIQKFEGIVTIASPYKILETNIPSGLVSFDGIVNWAEYNPRDIEENGDCVCEDYLMELYKI